MVALAEDAILKAIHTYHYLTIDQVMALLGRASLRHTQAKLKHLTDEGYLQRIPRHTTTRGGKLKPAYTLTNQTKRYLEDQGMLVSSPRVPKPYFLSHTLALN